MRKLLVLTVILMLGLVPQAQAFSINFETGTDGNPITDITGVSFVDFNGYPSIYGDSRLGYNTHSDDLNYGSGGYHHNGNMFLWAGEWADARGVKVDFTNNDGTWFRTGYSANTTSFYLDAFFTDGSSATVVGGSNYGSPMNFLQVNAPDGKFLDYVVLHDTGNYWLVDDMSGDATGVTDRVPEPGTLMLLGSGLFGLVGYRRAKRMM